MRLLNYPVILSVLLITSSCKSILQNTLGSFIYKREFLPSSTLPPKKFVTVIPFEFVDGKIIVKVRLNGETRERNFIFDTGATTFISDSISKELGLFPFTSKNHADLNGEIRSTNLFKIDISVGTFKVFGLGALAKDFTKTNKGCLNIDGILGMNILDQAVFQFDSEQRLLTITNSVNNIPPQKRINEIRLFKRWNGDSFIKLKVNGQKCNFLFDSGSDNFLIAKSGLFDHTIPIKQKAGYINALNSSKINNTISYYAIKDLKIGNKYSIASNDKFAVSYEGSSYNILGNEVFKSNAVTIDRSEGRLYLSANKSTGLDAIELSIPNLRFGWINKKIIISSITLGSNLQKMGLGLNDEVVKINNVPTSTFFDYCSFTVFQDDIMKLIEFNIVILKNDTELQYKITKEMLYE